MVCGKGTTFTVSLPPLFCHTGCESDDDSEIFNFLHFRLTAQGGGGNGPIVGLNTHMNHLVIFGDL